MKGFTVYNSYMTAAIATIGGMLFGFDISSVSGVVSQTPYLDYFHLSAQYNPNPIRQGGITASMAGGSFLSSLFAGYISDSIGRRYIIMLSSWIWMIGAAIQSSARNQGQLIAGRVIAGFAIGFASSQVPVYIAELSPKNIRGRLVACFQWAVTWGIMIMFFIAYGCSKINSTASFRLLWGIQIVPGFLLFLGTLILPESPRWLAKNDRWEEAIFIISQVQANGDASHPDVLIEVEEIKEAVRIDHEAKGVKFLDLFRKDSINRTMVGFWGQVWQQMTGVNVNMYYVVYVFQMAGYGGNVGLYSSAIQDVINMAMTVPAILYIDKWGRRPVLLAGSAMMCFWLIILVIMFAVFGTVQPIGSIPNAPNLTLEIVNHPAASKAAISASYLFTASFAVTWGPGVWIYVSEIFPSRQRAIANGFCASANWAFNFALAMFVPSAFKNINYKTFIIFVVCCAVSFFNVYFFFPETKGKTLEEVDQMWAAKVPAWRSASWEPRRPSLSDIRAAGGFITDAELKQQEIDHHEDEGEHEKAQHQEA